MYTHSWMLLTAELDYLTTPTTDTAGARNVPVRNVAATHTEAVYSLFPGLDGRKTLSPSTLDALRRRCARGNGDYD